ncbi:MAG TPA: fumarylacetoacetate hydrolase family protein, partial [Actinomycetota bacterium]|nr:fumarylacetoacetate hydrolase family protein [Actinomycetota bacterium]
MTYDRRGHRRLGALLEDRVVDLPDLVGHPAYPTTMERLVVSNGGTVFDVARAALEREDADLALVEHARLLTPVLPTALRSADADEGARPVAGPDEVLAWPLDAGWLELRPKITAILRRPVGDPVVREDVPSVVFGYTLVGDFLTHLGTGDPGPTTIGSPLAFGPCVVTPDELDLQTTYVTVRVDGKEWAKGDLNGTARTLLADVAAASRQERLAAGEAFASGPFELGRFDQRLWPGAEVEVEAEGIGVLRVRLGRPDAPGPRAI